MLGVEQCGGHCEQGEEEAEADSEPDFRIEIKRVNEEKPVRKKMFPFKRSLLLLSLIVSIIIIIDYNVHCGVIGNQNDPVPEEPSTLTCTNNDDRNCQVSRTTPLTDHSLFNTIYMLRFLNPKLLAKEYGVAMKGRASWLTCQVCSAAVALIRIYPSLYTVKTVFINACSIGYEEYRVCAGLAELFGEELMYIVTHSELANSEICGLVIGNSCMPKQADYPNGPKWSIPLLPLPDDVKNKLTALETSNQDETSNMDKQQNVSQILHLSDLHLDMYYQVNSAAACSEPLCCRATSQKSKRSYPAGTWGSLDNCDSVLRTVENLLATISQHHSDHYRYALFTGDYIPHDIWNTTKQEIVYTTRTFNNLVRKHVPKDKIIIPVIGNHESNPVDQFCPPTLNKQFSIEWLYNELLEQWQDWIPEEYHETFRTYGYYARIDGKTRFIVLNSNYCARLNFWNALKYIDMGDMLQWFQNQLNNATVAGQHVYIVGHIAPDEDECSSHWVLAYKRIINRYKNIIRGQFFGHTHLDEIRLYYSEPDPHAKPSSSSSSSSTPEPIGVAYLAPSVTTYFNVNPSFRFYATDPDTGVIVDHMTYYLNITKANLSHKQFNPYETYEPIWDFEYSARESYNMTSLTPQSWHEFVKNAIVEPLYLKRYYQHYGRYNEQQADSKSIPSMINVIDRVLV